jgi:hypothetical protein
MLRNSRFRLSQFLDRFSQNATPISLPDRHSSIQRYRREMNADHRTSGPEGVVDIQSKRAEYLSDLTESMLQNPVTEKLWGWTVTIA